MILCVSLTGGISKGALVRNTLHGTPLFMMRVKSVARAMVKATAMVGASENTHDIGSHNLTCLRTFCSDPSSSGSGSNTVPTNTEARKHLHPHSQIVPLPPVVFVLGGPGSGKGTQSERLAAMYHMKHISVGELLRTEQHSGSTQGELIARILGEGRIVPVEMSLSLLKAAMLATPIAYSATTTTTGTTTGAGVGADISTRTTNDANRGGFRGFLIDGFPRNEDNLQGWQAARMQDICDVKGCLFLDCTVEQLYKRLMLRGQNSKGIQKREDDEMEAIEKRFVVYKEATLPVIEYFQKNGMLWTIDGDRERDEVTAAAALCLLAKVKSVLI